MVLLLAAAAQGEVYKWVDDQGKVHYGSAPPAGARTQTMAPPPTPDPEAVRRAQLRDEELQQRYHAAEKAREGQAKADAAQAADKAKRDAQCRRMRQQLAVRETKVPVFHVDDKGNRVYMPDDQRLSDIAKLKQEIAESCP